jgi:hypothetical protein
MMQTTQKNSATNLEVRTLVCQVGDLSHTRGPIDPLTP